MARLACSGLNANQLQAVASDLPDRGGTSIPVFSFQLETKKHVAKHFVMQNITKTQGKKRSDRKFGYHYEYLLSNLSNHSHVYGLNRPRL